jgi:hypothetical protein
MQEQTEAPAKPLADMKGPRDLATIPDQKIDMFSARGFALAQRIAQAFATSDAVPPIFQSMNAKKKNGVVVEWVENPAAFGNCLIAIETAQAVGMSITAVMQNANIIENKLSWSGKFIIAAVNASKRFTALRFDVQETGMIKAKYKEKGEWNDARKKFNYIDHEIELPNIEWIAWALPYGCEFPKGVFTLKQAKEAGLPVIVGPRVSMRLAVEEGWYAKPGSKWQTDMRDLMGMYRSGAYFGNIHAPDVVMGMGRSTEEQIDMSTIDVERQPNGQYAAPATTLDEMRNTAPREEKHPEAETVVVTDKQPEDAAPPEEEVSEGDKQLAENADKPAAKEPLTPEVSAAYERLAGQLNAAPDLDKLAEAADLISTIPHSELRNALSGIYKQRYDQMMAAPPDVVQAEPEATQAPAKRTKRSTKAPE